MPHTYSLAPGERRVLAVWRAIQGWTGWLGTALLAISGALLAFGPAGGWPFRAGWVVLLAGLILQIWLGPRYTKLIKDERTARQRAQRRSHSMQTIMNVAVRTLMDDLSVDFSQARVSVYRHKDNHFILLCRRSDALNLEEPGRERYPDGEGLIGKAWRLGEGIVVDLPKERGTWEQTNYVDYGMPVETALNLAMQSRSLVGLRLDTSAADPEHIGLIVIESLAPRGVNGTTLDALRASTAAKLVNHVLVEAVVSLDEGDVVSFRESIQQST